MEIKQFRYASDNLGYLVHGPNQDVVIDGGDPEGILAFARENNIEIAWVANTHSHQDHTLGNGLLLEKTGASFLDCRSMVQGQTIDLDGETLEVLITPGHTDDSICFKGPGFLVSGDTLFNGTVGNCFSGDLAAYYHSLAMLMALPRETIIYSGHDYVRDSSAAAVSIEGDNSDIQAYGRAYDPELVVSSLADELKVNPYIRFNTPAMIERLRKKNMPCDTEAQRFASIMEVY